jgi:serine/threonine protein kinase
MEAPICRFYFKQIIMVLNYLHSKGVAHRDLKLDNFLLDANFNLKLIDYGMAGPTEGRDGKGMLKTRLGTPGYMAPEVVAKKPYEGILADIFALGVILFIMYLRAPPFDSTSANDYCYQKIAGDKADEFWAMHQNKGNQALLTPCFKQLLTSIF